MATANPAMSEAVYRRAGLAAMPTQAMTIQGTVLKTAPPFLGPAGLSLGTEAAKAIRMGRVPLLGFHLDSGHAKLERGDDRWGEYLDRLGSMLLHVHLSENDGTADQHLPLGAAPRSMTDWPKHVKKLKATGYDGTITLEVFAPEKEYLLLSWDLLPRWWAEA